MKKPTVSIMLDKLVHVVMSWEWFRKRAIREVARRNGQSKSAAKQAAARENGKQHKKGTKQKVVYRDADLQLDMFNA